MKKIKIIAVILAVLTGLSVYIFFQSLQKDSTKDYIPVVIAVKPIPARTAVTADMLEEKRLPPEAVHPLAAKTSKELIGLISEVPIEQGEQILSSKFVKQGQATAGLSYVIPKGKRAFTLPADNIIGIAGFIKPGDHVDVLTIMNTTDRNMQKTVGSALLFQNIEVLAAGKLVNDNGQINNQYDSVTLAVSSQDIVKLNLASSEGKIRLVLRQPSDEEIIKVNPQLNESLARELIGQ
jgi:pilus assembly protein CpaB